MVTSRSSKNKARILAAGEAALLGSGASGLRVDQVAAQAGVNKRMVYHYFGDRQGLVDAVLVRQLRRLSLSDSGLAEVTRLMLAAVATPTYDDLLPEAEMSTQQMVIAARIVLAYLCTREDAVFSPHKLTAQQWLQFTFELMSLAFVDAAIQALQTEPFTDGFRKLSEHLLTLNMPDLSAPPKRPKPRYRVTPVSRIK